MKRRTGRLLGAADGAAARGGGRGCAGLRTRLVREAADGAAARGGGLGCCDVDGAVCASRMG